MNLKFTKSDFYILVIFYLMAIPISLYGMDYSEGWTIPVATTFIYMIFSIISLYVIVYVLFQKFFPEKKLAALLITVVTFMVLLGSAEIWVYRWLNDSEGTIHSLFPFVMIALESTLENSGILLGIFLGKKFYDVQLDLQAKESEKKESELRLLKSQMDPHFLFNNLNTIDSLIDTNPQVAKTYLNKLSKLYRYLVRTKDDEVVSLEEELEFTENYIYLLEQRFGEAYIFNMSNKHKFEDLFIPPGALQTLIENIVKHNQGSSAVPIITEISIDENRVSVINNLILKKRKRDSFGVGLKNLKKRYKFLTDEPVIIASDENYRVSIPILKAVN